MDSKFMLRACLENLNSIDWKTRAGAASVLGMLGDRCAVEPLIRALSDDDRDVRHAAAEALGKLGEPAWREIVKGDDKDFARLGASGDRRAVELLIEVLRQGTCRARRTPAEALGTLRVEPLILKLDVEPLFVPLHDVRHAAVAAVALGRLGNNRAVEPLIRALSDDNRDVRRATTEALGKLGDSRAVEPLIRALSDDNGDVRRAAGSALGELGDPRAVEPLIRALSDDNRDVRRATTEALGKLGDSRAVEPLIRALSDSYIRRAAAEALGKLGEPTWCEVIKGDNEDFARLGASGDRRAVEPLIAALSNKSDYVRGAAAEALGRLGNSRAAEPLIPLLRDKSDDVRRAAAEALGELSDSRALEPLIQTLSAFDKSVDVRRGAARALGKLGDRRAVEPLIRALGDGHGRVRVAAAETLGRLGETTWGETVRGDDTDFARLAASVDPRAAEPLLTALSDIDDNVRRTAARALGKLGESRAVEPLIGALGSTDRDIRSAAAEALGELGDSRAVEPLIRNLSDGSDYARIAATEALGKLGDRRAVEPLIRALSHKCAGDIHAAAEALGKLRDPRAVEPLIKTLGRYHGNLFSGINGAAAEALGKLGDSRAVEPLIRALSHGDGDVRRAAAEALGKLGEPKWQGIIQGDLGDYARLAACGDAHAIELLVRALSNPQKGDRRAAAEALANLASTCPSAIGFRRWSNIRDLVTHPHWDRERGSSDCHEDGGIGLTFPMPPPGLDF